MIKKLRDEYRNQMITAVTAAFAFLIALTWRTPIQTTVSLIISKLNVHGSQVYVEYASAVVITLVAVLGIMFISKLKVEAEKKK